MTKCDIYNSIGCLNSEAIHASLGNIVKSVNSLNLQTFTKISKEN